MLRFSLQSGNLPPYDPLPRQFQLAAETGFEGLEVTAPSGTDEAKRILDAANQARLTIHSVTVRSIYQHFLSERDPSAAIHGTIEALRLARIGERTRFFSRRRKRRTRTATSSVWTAPEG